MDVVGFSDRFVHCSVGQGSEKMMISFCYGKNLAMDREDLWKSLNDFSRTNSIPWIVLGDFNAITWTTKKKRRSAGLYSFKSELQ